MHGATRSRPSRSPTESGLCCHRRSASGTSPLPELEPEEVQLRPSALSTADRDALADIVGAENCGVDDDARLLRAGGKSTLDLLRRRDPGVQDAPDAVLLPG